MTAPVIGITSTLDRAQSGVWDTTAVFLHWHYCEALIAAGGVVSVLPPQPALPDAVAAVLDGVSGLVVTGGGDLNAALYGQGEHPDNDSPHPVRDEWELALAREAVARDMPYLGICRGAQVLNVALGGSLIQHVPDLVGHKRHEGEGDQFGSIGVATVAGTRVAGLHPAQSVVPVYHHQAIDSPGVGLIVSAHSEDGIVEAVEFPDKTFCIGVQWHPEEDDRAELFEAFIAAAAVYSER